MGPESPKLVRQRKSAWLVLLVGAAVAAGLYGVMRLGGGAGGSSPVVREFKGGGAEAIHRALDRLYQGAEERRWELQPRPGEERPALAEVEVFRASRPVPHWHYVGSGLSELDAKTSSNREWSGLGVEYTLRLVDDGAEPPVWPINLLRWIAETGLATGEPAYARHSMDLPEGLLEKVSPGVQGLVFVADPDLGTIQTPNGKLTFLDVLPLVKRESWLLVAWDLDQYLEAVKAQQGDLLWRAGRASVLEGERGKELLARAAREGSSREAVYVDIAWNEREIVLDPVSREAVVQFLRYRLAHGRGVALLTGNRKVALSPGDWSMRCAAEECALAVPQGEAASLADQLAAAVHGTVVARPHGLRFRLDTP
jgi:suppressor of fused